jgi:hypothetical protein
VRLYVVWMPVLPGDSRQGLDESVLEDDRVRQFWDPGQRSGRWFAAERNLGLGPPLLWDAFLFFEPGARWDRVPKPLRGWGSPVIGQSDELRRELAPYLRG